VGTELDERAVACARANGVEVYRGDLFEPLPSDLRRRVDVIVAVVPYVPTGELHLLQRDTFRFESALAYDGGADGNRLLRAVVAGAPSFLRPGGRLILELGEGQAEAVAEELRRYGFSAIEPIRDVEGDVRGIEAQLRSL
jgi:release factor glutamine methyltransferase